MGIKTLLVGPSLGPTTAVPGEAQGHWYQHAVALATQTTKRVHIPLWSQRLRTSGFRAGLHRQIQILSGASGVQVTGKDPAPLMALINFTQRAFSQGDKQHQQQTSEEILGWSNQRTLRLPSSRAPRRVAPGGRCGRPRVPLERRLPSSKVNDSATGYAGPRPGEGMVGLESSRCLIPGKVLVSVFVPLPGNDAILMPSGGGGGVVSGSSLTAPVHGPLGPAEWILLKVVTIYL